MATQKRFINALPEALLKQRQHERKSDVRGDYYRDTTAIIHSSPFRRLKHKTHVFFSPANDHICTRMEHSLHVASVASAVCRGLNLDSELAWAIGMGHDLGHTPFGHVGENILTEMMEREGFSGFEHELNSLRVVDFLANQGRGLNLTYAVRDGIACHNGEVFEQSLMPTGQEKDLSALKSRKEAIPATWEGAVVRFCDQAAYLGRDFEDACRLSIIEKESLPKMVGERLGKTNAAIINTLVNDLIDSSTPERGIAFSDYIFEAVLEMKEFNYQNIYLSPLLQGYGPYFKRLFVLVIDYLKGLLENYGLDEELYFEEKNMLAGGFAHHVNEMYKPYMEHDGGLERLVYDYVAGMSDNFCLDCANEILKPERLNEAIEQSITGKWFDVKR